MILGIGQPDLAAGDAYYATGPDVIRIAQEVKALGASSIRFSAAWMFIDPYNSKKYKWANLDRAVTACRDAGLDILLTIEPRTRSNAADFGLLCAAIAARYEGQIAWFEIGNEVNSFGNSVSPHDPAKFVEFQKQAYDNIMPHAPDSLVFAAALMAIGTGFFTLSPIEWTQGFINSNGPDFCHALSMHPYMRDGRTYVPQLPTADNWSFKNIEAIRAMLDNAGATSTLIACTEFGYDSMTSPSGLSTTPAQLEDEQAANVTILYNLLKAYADAGTIYDRVWPFMYQDWEQPDRKAGYHYGMVHDDYTKKPEWFFFRALSTPWPGVVTDSVGITDSAVVALRPPAFPATDVVGITDTASFVIPSGDADWVSVGTADRDTSIGLTTTLTWSHVVSSVSSGALTSGLVVSTDHVKPWELYNTLSVTSSIDGALTRLGSRHISSSSDKKGSLHIFGLAYTDGTVKQPTAGTHTLTAVVTLNSDGVTSLTAVAGNSLLHRNVSQFGSVYSNGNVSGTPNIAASSAAGDRALCVLGGTGDFNPTFNQTVRYHDGSTVDGHGDYILIGDAAGAATVNFLTTIDFQRYGALALDLIHGVGTTGGDDPPPPPPPPLTSEFVIRDNTTGNLMLGGSRFRFGGANVANDIGLVAAANGNAYGGVAHTTNSYSAYLTPHSQIDAVLGSASAMKLGVLKAAWSAHTTNHVDAVQPTLGVFNAAALEPLDYAIKQAKGLGIRFVIPFSENYTTKPWYSTATGGSDTANDLYLRPASVAAYKAHISFVLNHVNPYTGVALKNEPQILCWETQNEGTGPGVSQVQWTAWADDIGHHIKVVEGAQQLVQDGHYGPQSDTIQNSVYTDIFDQHAYDQYRTPAFLEGQAADCHAHGKAYFVGEMDVYDAAVHTPEWTTYEQMVAFEASSNIDGFTFWDLLAPLTNWSDGFTLHFPGSTRYMQDVGDMLSDTAQRLAGMPPKVFVSDTFTGTNGTVLGSGHTGEVGAKWDFNNGWTGIGTITNNRLWFGSAESHYFASGVPASRNFEVEVAVYTASLLNGSYIGPTVHSFTTYYNYSYVAYVWNNAGTIRVRIDYYRDGSSALQLGSATITAPTVGSTHNLKLRVQGSVLTAYWDNVPVVGPVTNTSLPFAGRAGLIGDGSTATTGFHIDSITATDL